jgi:hypothetical protein
MQVHVGRVFEDEIIRRRQSEIQGDFQVASSSLHSLLSLVMPILSTIGAFEWRIFENRGLLP